MFVVMKHSTGQLRLSHDQLTSVRISSGRFLPKSACWTQNVACDILLLDCYRYDLSTVLAAER